MAHFTSTDVRTILKLWNDGVKAKEIAERFGRSTGSIYSLIHRTKHGWTPDGPDSPQVRNLRIARIVWLFEQGVTLTELGLIFGVTGTAISATLTSVGLDSELRREVVAKLPPIARIAHQLH
jgi:transposase